MRVLTLVWPNQCRAERWGEGVSADTWPGLADTLVDACARDPSNPTLVKIAATVSQFLGRGGYERVHARMRSALAGAQQQPTGAVAPPNGIFERLLPLLLLRLLPLDAFTEDLVGGFGSGEGSTAAAQQALQPGAPGVPAAAAQPVGALLLQARILQDHPHSLFFRPQQSPQLSLLLSTSHTVHLQMATDLAEDSEVRKLSAELLGRWPPRLACALP